MQFNSYLIYSLYECRYTFLHFNHISYKKHTAAIETRNVNKTSLSFNSNPEKTHSLIPSPILPPNLPPPPAEGESAVVDGPEATEGGVGEEVEESGWPGEEEDPFAAPKEENLTETHIEDEAEGSGSARSIAG